MLENGLFWEIGLSVLAFAGLVYWIASPRSHEPPHREIEPDYKRRERQPWADENSRGRGNR